MLGIVQPPRREPRVDRVGGGDHGLEVVGDQDLEDTAEESPGRLTAGDHRSQGLGVGQPHEHVPRHHRGEDQGVHPALLPGLGVEDESHLGEVDLTLDTGLAVDDADRSGLDPEPAAFDREPVQRPIRHPAALPGQQLLDLHDAQRVMAVATSHPGLDLGFV